MFRIGFVYFWTVTWLLSVVAAQNIAIKKINIIYDVFFLFGVGSELGFGSSTSNRT